MSTFHLDHLLESTQGFQTAVWGPPAWLFLHCVTLNYNPQANPAQRKAYRQFFRALAGVLPCGVCRDNYADTLAHHPELRWSRRTFASRRALAYWLFRMHNYVCRSRTPCRNPTYTDDEDGFARMVVDYSRFRARCPPSASKKKKASHARAGCVTPVRGGVRLRSRVRILPRGRDA